MKVILETERLLLREFSLDDAAFIMELANTPDWIEYIGDKNIKTIQQAKDYLVGPLKSYEINGFGSSLVALKPGGIPIGSCGIIKRDQLENPDIGFAFLPAYYGKGYAYEIASATLQHAKEIYKLNVISAIVLEKNIPSGNLLTKLGLTFEKNITFPNNVEELQLFKINLK